MESLVMNTLRSLESKNVSMHDGRRDHGNDAAFSGAALGNEI